MIKYQVAKPFFPEDDISDICSSIKAILQGNGLLTMGENVCEFEKEFASYIGAKFAVATNSCTSALEAALYALGIKEGDEVIVPCQTFIATGAAVVLSGATPIFAEVDEDFQLDIEDVKQRISQKTKAVIIVHFAGKISQRIFELRDFLKARNIFLIEDCAHAHGASINGKKAGSIGDVGCFSFYSTKIMTTGEGGMLTCSDEWIWEKASSFRNRGRDLKQQDEIYSSIGKNARMSEIQGLLGRYQLKRLDDFVSKRNLLVQRYRKNFYSLERDGWIRYQNIGKGELCAYWRFVVFLADELSCHRDKILLGLRNNSIAGDAPYKPLLHLQPVFKDKYSIKTGMLSKSESLALKHICLPMHCDLNEKDIDFISEVFLKLVKGLI